MRRLAGHLPKDEILPLHRTHPDREKELAALRAFPGTLDRVGFHFG